ncbi:MAG: hypothetical protein Kow0075_15970 [Salibacteraceae bacterium]
MSSLKTGHFILISCTIAVVVLLLLAPHHPQQSAAQGAETAEPPRDEYLIDSALTLIGGTQPMQGILLLREVAEQNPSNIRAQYHLGIFSAQTGQWEKVKERFNKVLEIDPEFAEAHFWLGKAEYMLGNQAAAEKHLMQFLNEEPNKEALRQEAQDLLNQNI